MARRFDLVAYLKLFRFPLVFTAIADSWAGYFVSYLLASQHGEPWAFQVSRLGNLALISGGLYLFGMSLNDIADQKKDKESAPNKVIPSGRVSPRGAVIASSMMLGLSILGVFTAPVQSQIRIQVVWGLALLAILLYDLGWVKIPPIMGLVRVFNFSIGLVTTRFLDPLDVTLLVAPEFLYVTALTYVSTLEDVALDKLRLRGGIIGMGLAVLLAACLYSTAYYVRFPLIWAGGWHQAIVLAIAWIQVAWLVRRGWNAADKRGIMLLVRDGVAGIIVLDAVLVAGAVNWIHALIVGALILPAILSLAIFKRLA